MLKRHEVEWVKYLSQQGLSRRAIALKTRFARDTVRKILDGNRPDYEAIRAEQESDVTPLFSGPIERCPTCGGRVYMPCIACHVRQFSAAELTPADVPATFRRRPGRSSLAAALRRENSGQSQVSPHKRCA